MKEASIHLKLNKNNTVHRHHVTPIEALLLVSEHHKLVGDNPVEVDKSTIKDAITVDEVGPEEVAQPEQVNALGTIVRHAVMKPGKVLKSHPRTLDEEIERLRRRYRTDVIDNLLNKFRELPGENYDDAVKKGIQLASPNAGMGAVASVKLI